LTDAWTLLTFFVKPKARNNKSGVNPPKFFSPDVAAERRFYLDLNPKKNISLAVVSGGVEHSTPHYAIHRKTFAFNTIEYVARGNGTLKLNGREYSLQPGRLFSYGPGIAQDITGDPANPLIKYFVNFAGTRARRLLRLCHLSPGNVSEVFPANALQPLFDELIRTGLQMRRESSNLHAKLLECLVLRIQGTQAPIEVAESYSFATFQQCRLYIEENSQKLQTLDQIANSCHVNKAYLCRLFQRYDIQSPYQYLLQLKMRYAAERLHEPGVLVKQVAEELGFSDQFHFSRVFHSVFGVSPMTFRRLH
jgi:AraC-like DNA-binding protein/quercetin dioxygenase-like cupin family protein